MLVALFALLVLASAQYDARIFLSVDCAAMSFEDIQGHPENVDGVYSYNHDAACVQGCVDGDGITSVFTLCNVGGSGLDLTPVTEGEVPVYFYTYAEAGCGGDALAWGGFVSDRCVNFYAQGEGPTNASFSYECGVVNYWNGFGCDAGVGNITVTEFGSACVANPSGFSDGFSTVTCEVPTCFHKDTAITYGAEKLTMKQLESHPSCSIPHVVKSSGVKISTSCGQPLRLTDDHLVYTQAGLRTAASIKLGDFLYNDLNEKTICEVTKVEVDPAQEYFGLNCEESIVLANGYKTSTFGITHDLPAIWMKYASKVLGISGASSFGDMVANFLSYWKFL